MVDSFYLKLLANLLFETSSILHQIETPSSWFLSFLFTEIPLDFFVQQFFWTGYSPYLNCMSANHKPNIE